MQDRSKQIDDQLKTMTAAQQDQFLGQLPEADLQAYAEFSARNNPSPQGEVQQTEIGRFGVQHGEAPKAAPPREPTEDEMANMTDDQLAKLAKGDTLNTTEVQENKTGMGGWLDNKVGMTARAAMKGVAALPGLVIDHTILPAVDAITGDERKVSDVGTQGLVDQLADQYGMMEPKTRGQRVASDVVSAVASVPTGMGLGKSLSMLPKGGAGLLGKTSEAVAKFGNMMTKQPLMQAASATTGALAAGNVREDGGTPVEQLVASLAAGSVPQLASGVKNAGLRAAMRGGAEGAQNMRNNIATFEAAGTTPSVGQATGGSKAKAVEAFLSRLFGSSSVVQKLGRAQEEGIGNKIIEKVDELSPGATSTGAGDRVVQDYQNTFLPNAKKMLQGQYQQLDKVLPGDSIVPADNLKNFLEGKTVPTKGAERLTTDSTIRPSMKNWASTLRNLNIDLKKNGGLSYQGLKEARTYIGDQLSDTLFSETKKVPTKELRAAYAAMSDDMLQAARKAGAEKEFAKANEMAKKFYDHLELIEPIVDKAGGGEKIFKAAISGLDDGATRLEAVYNTIPNAGRKYLSSAIIRRMAKADPNTDEFNLQLFFKNYNKLSEEAKSQIFGRVGSEFKKNFEEIQKAAKIIRVDREDFGVATSPKEGRTGLQMILYPLMFTVGGGVAGATGGGGSTLAAGAGALAGTGLALGGARMVAKWMTNPKTVKYLAEANRIPPSQLPQMINQIAQQNARDHDPDLEEFEAYLKEQAGKQ